MGKNAYATFYTYYSEFIKLYAYNSEENSHYNNCLPIVESNNSPTTEQFNRVVFDEIIFLQHRQECDIFYAPTQTHSKDFSKKSYNITIQQLAPLADRPFDFQNLQNTGWSQEMIDMERRRFEWQRSFQGRISCQITNMNFKEDLENDQEIKYISLIRKNIFNPDPIYYSIGWSFALAVWFSFALEIARYIAPQKTAASKIFSLLFVSIASIFIDLFDKKLNADIDKRPFHINFQNTPTHDFSKWFCVFKNSTHRIAEKYFPYKPKLS